MNGFTESHSVSIQPYEPQPDVLYPIETVSQLAHVPRRSIAVYCRHGFVSPATDPGREGWMFDAAAIRRLRRIQRLRTTADLGLPTIGVILALTEEVERLRRRVRLMEER